MDETEALCTNIGIMVNGELKCLGSLQNLKSKYGEGYTLLAKIKLNETNETLGGGRIDLVDKFVSFITRHFVDKSKLKESRDGFVNIHINENSASVLSKVFSLIENNKQEFAIEYYVVTQTKLEQIFLNFASRQIDPATRILQNQGIISNLRSYIFGQR
jgi:ATP-binding cassette, subfamily A (ABC1), member 3